MSTKLKLKNTSDPISDYLTRIRNAVAARHRLVEIPSSNMKKEITKILLEQGYILNYKIENTPYKQELIKIALKYHPSTKLPAIRGLKRISTPGLRKYVKASKIPRVMNGLGIAILSTPKGIITDKEARKLNVGGEVLCYIY